MKTVVRKQMNDQQRALVVENMDHAKKIARQYMRKGVLLEDLEQEACEALCYAAMRFNPDKGCTLATFSTMFINGCLSKYIMRHCENSYLSKQQRVFVKVMSLEQLCGDDGDVKWEDVIGDESDDEYEEQQEMFDLLDYVLNNISADEQELIGKIFGLNGESTSIVDLAKQMKYSRNTLTQRYNDIMIKMKELAEKYIVEHNN